MSATYKTEGIILRRTDFKDKDRLVVCLTPTYGKVTARVISVKKPTAKLAGHIEPFVRGEFFFAKSKTIDILAGSHITDAHHQIRQSISHIAGIGFFVDIIDALTENNQSDNALFEHVADTCAWMNEHPFSTSVLYAALLQLLSVLGYHMEWNVCHQCKESITTDAKFHYQLLSVECPKCVSPEQTIPLHFSTIKVLRYMQHSSYDAVCRLAFPPDVWRETDAFLRSLIRYHVGKEMPSEEVFLQLLTSSQ